MKVFRRIGVLIGALVWPLIAAGQTNVTSSFGFGSVSAGTTNSNVTFYNNTCGQLIDPQSATQSGPFTCTWPSSVNYYQNGAMSITFSTATARICSEFYSAKTSPAV